MKIKHSILSLLFLSFFTIQAQAQPQNALHFDGVDDYVSSFTGGIQGGGARSVEAWIKTTVNSITNQQVILDWGTQTLGGRFTFCLLNNNAIRLEISGSGVSGTIPVNDGQWHHVAAVYNPLATQKVTLYVDGVLDIAGNFSNPVNTTTGAVRVGIRVDDVNHFTGYIDEVRIWNQAISQNEIVNNMNGEICNATNSLQFYYNFNQGVANGNNSSALTAYDLSGNARNAFLYNFSLGGVNSNWTIGPNITPGAVQHTENLDSCDPYTWPVTGNTYNQSGTYHGVTTAANGCDSVIELRLNITGSDDEVSDRTGCDEFYWAISQQTYSASGTYPVQVTNAEGCPFTHTLNLTLNESDTVLENVSACQSYFWQPLGDTLTISGSYEVVLQNVHGCDSVLRLNLDITSANLGTVLNGNTIASLADNISYQWLDCADNFAPIPGETSQEFTFSQGGEYAVELTFGNFGACVDTSVCQTISLMNLSENIKETWSIHPNPAQNVVTVELGPNSSTLEVFNALGTSIYQKENDAQSIKLDVSEWSRGVYWFRVNQSDTVTYKKLIVN